MRQQDNRGNGVLARSTARYARRALVIGNQSYAPEVGPLTNPVNDAQAMEAALKRAGFQVDLHLNLDSQPKSKTHLMVVITNFIKTLDDAREGLIYFAGHGIQSNCTNFLVPVDATC